MSLFSRLVVLLLTVSLPLWPPFSARAVSEPQDKLRAPVGADPSPAPPALQAEPKPPAPAETPAERDGKEKDAAKKPLGSLILAVKLALLADARLFHYEIEAEEDRHTVTLTGRVSTEEDKAAAAGVAQAVPGVKAVVNKLDLDQALGQALRKRQDDAITALVKERFARSATLKAANFEVYTEEGVVSIRGAVRFQVIALEAAEAARHVPGVKAVNTDKVRLESEG